MNDNNENKDFECKQIINKKDYYDILGLKKSANEDEIRKSYKKLAIKFHPDKNNSPFSADAFNKVSHAFTVLSNKEKRQTYDMFGTDENIGVRNSGRGFNPNEDPFMFFGGHSPFEFQNMNRNNSTQYVFKNGNAEYKVFSGGRSQTVFSQMQDSGEENDDDIFNQFFNHTLHRSHSRNINQNQRNENRNFRQTNSNHNTNNERSNQTNNIRINRSSNLCLVLMQFIPVFFLLFFVLTPYFLQRI